MRDGGTLQDHLESRWRQSGQMPPELDIGSLPEELEYVWGWFWSLSSERHHTDTGAPQPLSSEQIRAWQELRGLRLTNFELGVIRALDGQLMLAQGKSEAVKGK